MMNWIIAVFGLLSIGSQIVTRKLHEREKPLILVVVNYGAIICIILLSSYDQYVIYKKDEAYRQARLEIKILSEVNKYFIPVLKGIRNLQKNMLTVKSYLSHQNAQEKYPEFAVVLDWNKVSSESHKYELKSFKKHFNGIQESAAEIIKLKISHGSLIPDETFEWANKTISIKFSDVEQFFDTYTSANEKPNATVLSYAEQTGRAFGIVTGKLQAATSVLADD